MNRRIGMLCSLLALQPGLAQAAVYILIDGIPGAVTAQGYQNWHQGSSFSWEINKANAALPFGLDVVMPQRSASFASIKQAAFNGTAIKRIVMDQTMTGANGASVVFARLTCEGATITTMAFSGQGDSLPSVQLKIGCARLTWEDFDYSASGALLRSVKGDTTLIAK